jgi:DeoR family transcriptional regulator of aga operon
MITDRQARIFEQLVRRGSLDVTQLSELLQVSPSTVRRELRVMQANGLLARSHGGAQPYAPLRYSAPFTRRAAHQIEAKRRIATRARELIRPGAVIGMGGGTTLTELARQLRVIPGITVVTNALNVALELQGAPSPDWRLMVTGGTLKPNSYDLVGSGVAESLGSVHLDIAFLGCSGIDTGFGFSMADESEAAVGRAFIAAADQTVVLADHTKIGKTSFARLCPLSDVDVLITDSGITSGQRVALQTSGLRVLVADAPG